MALLRIAVAAVGYGEICGRLAITAIESRDGLSHVDEASAEEGVLGPGATGWTECPNAEGLGRPLKQQVIPGRLGLDFEEVYTLIQGSVAAVEKFFKLVAE